MTDDRRPPPSVIGHRSSVDRHRSYIFYTFHKMWIFVLEIVHMVR